MQSIEKQIAETSFRPSEAAQKYLEQYGDPIVTNTYLKLTILILAIVSLVTLSLFYRAQMALSTMKPLVIRINDVGRAEAIDYQNFAYRPQEAENRYFLSEWARDYYGRNHYTIRKDFTNALYFLNGDLQNAIPGTRSPAALALRGREYPLELSGSAWIDPQTGVIAHKCRCSGRAGATICLRTRVRLISPPVRYRALAGA